MSVRRCGLLNKLPVCRRWEEERIAWARSQSPLWLSEVKKRIPNLNVKQAVEDIENSQIESYPPLLKKTLISNANSINSPVAPLKGNKVTVTKRVSFRKNKPQAPNFNHEEAQLLGTVEKRKKVMILDTFIVPINSITTVWAKVRKCDVACN